MTERCAIFLEGLFPTRRSTDNHTSNSRHNF
jgi:hypothetical protein